VQDHARSVDDRQEGGLRPGGQAGLGLGQDVGWGGQGRPGVDLKRGRGFEAGADVVQRSAQRV